MSINRLFDLIEEARGSANWRAAFGEPQLVEGVTLIPVAQVGYGFGLGFGRGTQPGEEQGEGEPPASGEGGGGGATARPLGTLVVSEGEVAFQPTTDAGKVTLASLAVGALALWELSRILRALLGRR
ncbi:MAG TPA: spore germination protein GerW family protein [Anaerolineae bacterium]|nr:spore germination protein GerW family protein [Anaerolineae bacterium]